MHFISTRTFEKVADENLSAFSETTPNHGTCHYGTEEEQNDAKERRKEREEMGKKDDAAFVFIMPNDKNHSHRK